jgi:hypothetical protein
VWAFTGSSFMSLRIPILSMVFSSFLIFVISTLNLLDDNCFCRASFLSSHKYFWWAVSVRCLWIFLFSFDYGLLTCCGFSCGFFGFAVESHLCQILFDSVEMNLDLPPQFTLRFCAANRCLFLQGSFPEPISSPFFLLVNPFNCTIYSGNLEYTKFWLLSCYKYQKYHQDIIKPQKRHHVKFWLFWSTFFHEMNKSRNWIKYNNNSFVIVLYSIVELCLLYQLYHL